MKIRKEILDFAKIMEEKLRENDHKGGWEDCEWAFLIRRMREEVTELRKAVSNCDYNKPETRIKVQREAADVANFAMMVADNYGPIPN